MADEATPDADRAGADELAAIRDDAAALGPELARALGDLDGRGIDGAAAGLEAIAHRAAGLAAMARSLHAPEGVQLWPPPAGATATTDPDHGTLS